MPMLKKGHSTSQKNKWEKRQALSVLLRPRAELIKLTHHTGCWKWRRKMLCGIFLQTVIFPLWWEKQRVLCTLHLNKCPWLSCGCREVCVYLESGEWRTASLEIKNRINEKSAAFVPSQIISWFEKVPYSVILLHSSCEKTSRNQV